MKQHISFKLLSDNHMNAIVNLVQQMHEELSLNDIETFQKEMFNYENYKCFGLFEKEHLIGVSSGWISVRFYSGRQLEVVNVIIDNKLQSKGYGKLFFEHIELWAKQNDCKSVELNTYVQNSRSHKFYFNLGYAIYGYHFVKPL